MPVEPSRPVPVWLLDVDGVLNAPAPRWDGPPARGRATHSGVEYPMLWAPELLSRLHRRHREGVVELRWATTWVDESAQLERLLGLPPLATAFSRLGAAPAEKAPVHKLEAALRVLEQEGRPLIWTDDDAIPVRGGPLDGMLERLHAAGPPVLLVTPDPRFGLQPEHLQAVDEFLAGPLRDHRVSIRPPHRG